MPDFRACLAALQVVAAIALAAPAASAQDPSPPNVVFILVDDHRYDALGFLDPVIETPRLDQMAREGVHYTNAFVTTSLCSPSRASILTGQYMHDHGVVDNNRPAREGTIYFPTYLQQSGYETAFVGKWHMGGHSDDPQPGFDHWVSFRGQGDYYPGANPNRESTLNINGERVAQKGYITDELTDYALEWLENGRDEEAPFFLYLSHKAVHDNFSPAERHKDLYADAELSPPATMAPSAETDANKPMWVRNQRNSWHGVEYPYHSTIDVMDYYRSYIRALAGVDDSVGPRSRLSERSRLG